MKLRFCGKSGEVRGEYNQYALYTYVNFSENKLKNIWGKEWIMKQDLVNWKDLFFHRRKYNLGYVHISGIDCHSFTVFTIGIYWDVHQNCQPFLLGFTFVLDSLSYFTWILVFFLHVSCAPHACLVPVEVKKKTLDP